MTSQFATATPEWKGDAGQQDLAQRTFTTLLLQGSLFPENVPIRQTLAGLADFFAAEDGGDVEALMPQIDAALIANSHVFRRTETEDAVIFATTRRGYYTEPEVDTKHSFAKRLHEPENPLPIDDLDVIITRTRPALTTVEPVYISDYWQQRAPASPADEGMAAVPPVTRSEPVPTLSPEDAALFDDEEEVTPVAPVAPTPVATPAMDAANERSLPPRQSVSSTTITLEDGATIDLNQPAEAIIASQGPALAEAIHKAITDDPLRRIVSFGDEYYPEDAVVSLSKGDLRRIREYIVEQGEPMPDTSILNDVYYKTPRDHDFATFRFALNYRLNREKDFEFVGVPGVRLWSAKGLPVIGTKRLKAAELGQYYAFLEEQPELDDSLSTVSADEIRQARQVSRFLTFFEWEYGVLPFDAAMKALLPSALLPDQRTAALRIEAPQHYTVYLAELRFPTANRGGWLHGLEDFFKEHLIPGALITLAATDDPSVWTIQYGETSGNEVKLLQQDDKRARYAFAKHTYYADADESLIPSQERLTRLKNMKILPPGERRRITSTAGYVLEHVGQSIEGEPGGYELSLDDLFIGVNVQRPASRVFLREALTEEEHFRVQGDMIAYFPPPDDLEELSSNTSQDFDEDDA